MIIADIVFVLVGLAIVILSANRGFFKTLMNSAKFFLAIGASFLFGNMLAPWISEKLPMLGGKVLPNVLSYVLVFVLSFVILTIITFLIGAAIERLYIIRKIDIVFGALFGVLWAGMLLLVAASIIKFIPATQQIYQNSTVIKFFGESTFLETFKFFDFGKAWFETLLG